MAKLIDPVSQHVWKTKYCVEGDKNVEETWQRVAKFVASKEKSAEKKSWYNVYLNILDDFKFIPGGRILAGSASKHNVTLFNCFVMGSIPDSLSGIFTSLQEGAVTLQQGGGVGFDFSTLRPHGSITKKSGATASGPVSFMEIWDHMSATMQSTGARRGAMMGVLRCDHPDIEKFIEAKSEAGKLTHFNISVLISDTFMQAVDKDEAWRLIFPKIRSLPNKKLIQQSWPGYKNKVPCYIYKEISARELWKKIIRSAYDCAEPGVLFEDTINRYNNLYYREHIYATNPCGEVPLPAYGACNLGSINLTQFIENPFHEKTKFNWSSFENIIINSVRFLDNIIDLSKYPLKQQELEAFATRRIGLGITGLADALVMLNLHYASDKTKSFVEKLIKTFRDLSWQSSIELAKSRGNFPEYNKKLYLQGDFVQSLSDELIKQISRYGMRNSHHNVIAPAGSISLLANNISGGIEPIFSAEYDRTIRNEDGRKTQYQLKDYAYHLWLKSHDKNSLPPAWIDAQSLAPEQHLAIQAIAQKYIDGAISKTIFIPEKYSFKKVQNIYEKAFELGLKGCTIYRPNKITGSVLSSTKNEKKGICCGEK